MPLKHGCRAGLSSITRHPRGAEQEKGEGHGLSRRQIERGPDSERGQQPKLPQQQRVPVTRSGFPRVSAKPPRLCSPLLPSAQAFPHERSHGGDYESDWLDQFWKITIHFCRALSCCLKGNLSTDRSEEPLPQSGKSASLCTEWPHHESCLVPTHLLLLTAGTKNLKRTSLM